MKNKTKLVKYLRITKNSANRYLTLTKFIKDNNIDIFDPYLEFRYDHIKRELIQVQSDIHVYGFKYRLASMMKPYYINE